MSNTVFEGDEWKYAKNPPFEDNTTRATRQAKINADYATRRMSLDAWRTCTDELSQQTAAGEPFGRPR